MKPLHLALQLLWLNDGTHANPIGDHFLAESWMKYLLRRPDVASVQIAGPQQAFAHAPDVVVHFHPGLPLHPTAKNVMYHQSAWSPEQFAGGTVGVYHAIKDRYDGHLFVSETLKTKCEGDGAVIAFAADPEDMGYQPDTRYMHPVCFIGSDIRGDAANERYLVPAIAHGLVLYGGPYRDPRLQACHRGRLSDADLPKVYSSARVNLNVTIPAHAAMGVVNHRVYQILACGGVVATDGFETLGEIRPFAYELLGGREDRIDTIFEMSEEDNTEEFRRSRRAFVLEKHTVAHRCEDLVTYIKEII